MARVISRQPNTVIIGFIVPKTMAFLWSAGWFLISSPIRPSREVDGPQLPTYESQGLPSGNPGFASAIDSKVIGNFIRQVLDKNNLRGPTFRGCFSVIYSNNNNNDSTEYVDDKGRRVDRSTWFFSRSEKLHWFSQYCLPRSFVKPLLN